MNYVSCLTLCFTNGLFNLDPIQSLDYFAQNSNSTKTYFTEREIQRSFQNYSEYVQTQWKEPVIRGKSFDFIRQNTSLTNFHVADRIREEWVYDHVETDVDQNRRLL